MRKLEVKASDEMHAKLDFHAGAYDCNKSDLTRAAIILGLKALEDGRSTTGLSTKSWIAALNGRLK